MDETKIREVLGDAGPGVAEMLIDYIRSLEAENERLRRLFAWTDNPSCYEVKVRDGDAQASFLLSKSMVNGAVDADRHCGYELIRAIEQINKLKGF